MSGDLKETGRVEAFSDGVFAFAITLLVLNLRDPTFDPLLGQISLFQGLLAQWPSLFALISSFLTVLIMWVNHHNMFTHIKKINTTFLFLNGLLLFFVVLTPFTTLLVANHVSFSQTGDGMTAAAVYSGCFLLLGLVWTMVGVYSSRSMLITGRRTERRFFVGPVSYTIAFGLSFISGLASVVVILVAAGFFTVYARELWRVVPA